MIHSEDDGVVVVVVGGFISPSQDQPPGSGGPQNNRAPDKSSLSQVELFQHYMAEYDELVENPTSQFYQEIAAARKLLPKPIAGILVAPAVRDEVIRDFPTIDWRLELFQAALAHVDAYSETPSPKGDTRMVEVKSELRSCIQTCAAIPGLLDQIRRDLAKFVFPDLNGFLEEGSFSYSDLRTRAEIKRANSPSFLQPQDLVDTTLKRLDRAIQGLVRLQSLYDADMREVESWSQHSVILAGYERRSTPIKEAQLLLSETLRQTLHKIEESLLRPSENQSG